MLLDGAISSDGQTALYTSMYGLYVSQDAGNTFSTVSGFGGLSQDAHMFDGTSMAAVGSFIVPPGGDNTAGTYKRGYITHCNT